MRCCYNASVQKRMMCSDLSYVLCTNFNIPLCPRIFILVCTSIRMHMLWSTQADKHWSCECVLPLRDVLQCRQHNRTLAIYDRAHARSHAMQSLLLIVRVCAEPRRALGALGALLTAKSWKADRRTGSLNVLDLFAKAACTLVRALSGRPQNPWNTPSRPKASLISQNMLALASAAPPK